MAFQIRDLFFVIESTPQGDRTRLLLKARNEQTAAIEAVHELACPGRTDKPGFVALDRLEDLKNALVDLEAQLQQAVRSAQDEDTK